MNEQTASLRIIAALWTIAAPATANERVFYVTGSAQKVCQVTGLSVAGIPLFGVA